MVKVAKSGNKIIRYDRRYADFLIEGANQHIEKLVDREPTMVDLDRFIYEWLDEYGKNGNSTKLLNALNFYNCHIGHQCQMQKIENKLRLVFIAHMPHKPHPAMFVAYMFPNIVSRGWMENVKRCANPECTKFYQGRSNVKWCSPRCGSHFRVKKMRKKNRKDEI